jgi:hypothetical protein
MASGNTIFEWGPTAPGTWMPITTFDDPDLQHISRIAISRRGDRIAMVSMPRDETLIRNLRAASKAAIAAHAIDGVVASMEDSVLITPGSGGRITGIAEVRA